MLPLSDGPSPSSGDLKEGGSTTDPSKLPVPQFSADELDKALRKVRVRAYEMAQVGEWKLLSRLAKKIEARRSALGDDFIHKVADYRPKGTDLSILHLLCLNRAPKALLIQWLDLSKDKETEAPVTFKLGEKKLEGGNVRPAHLALITGNVDALEVLHHAKCDLKGKTSTGASVQSLFPLLFTNSQRVFILKMLLRCGIDPFEKDGKHGSLFTQSLENETLNETVAVLKGESHAQLAKSGAYRGDYQRVVLAPIVQSFLYSLNDKFQEAHSEKLLTLIERLARPNDREFLKRAFNIYFKKIETGEKSPVLHTAIQHKRALDFVPRILKLGANPNASGTYLGIRQTTAVHLACELAIPGLVSIFRKAGAKMDLKNQLGETPQEIFVKRVLLENPLSAQSKVVAATVREIFGEVETGVAEVLALSGARKKHAYGLETVYAMMEDEGLDFDLADSSLGGALFGISPVVLSSAHLFGRFKKPFGLSFGHHLLIMKATQELYQDRLIANGDSRSFTEILPHLLTLYPPQVSHMVARPFEIRMDSGPRQKDHPNLVELMALINHPKDPLMDPNNVGAVLTALTSASRWSFAPTGRTVRNWAKIGSFSFSFGFWKYDAMRIAGEHGACLLEDYGFERCPKRGSDSFFSGEKTGKHWYGPGFWMPPGKVNFSYRKTNSQGKVEYKRFDSETSVEFRRSYLSLSHPKYGTLIIRNSSREFGRDLFPYPAYWSKKYYPGPLPDSVLSQIGSPKDRKLLRELSIIEKGGTVPKPKVVREKTKKLTEDEIGKIINFEEELENSQKTPTSSAFHQVTEQSIYRNQDKPNSPSAAIEFLLEQLYALKQDYAGWKFDTRLETAWQDWGEYGTQLVGGYHSRGFGSVVTFLKDRMEKSELSGGKTPLPDLAFVHPDYPPWSEYHYTGPHGNAKRLRLTPKVVEVLDALAHGEAKEADLVETGIRTFFQEAGFNVQGELVFLD